METRWWCELLDETQFPTDLKYNINQMVKDFINTYSRFDDTSLLSELNQSGIIYNPPAEFVSMMRFARETFDVTDGVFNISVGGTLHELGYGKRTHANPVHKTFWNEAVATDDVIKLPAQTTIDFGGFGKGWLIDKLGELFQTAGFEQFIINGGDILVSSSQSVTLALEHPTDPSMAVGYIEITHGALAVSSRIKRSWRIPSSETKHHIIDPGTNDSSDGNVASTYVRADSALIADTVATVLLIRPELTEKIRRLYSISVHFV